MIDMYPLDSFLPSQSISNSCLSSFLYFSGSVYRTPFASAFLTAASIVFPDIVAPLITSTSLVFWSIISGIIVSAGVPFPFS